MKKYKLNFKRPLTVDEINRLGELLGNVGGLVPYAGTDWVLSTNAPHHVFRVLMAQNFPDVYEGCQPGA